MTVKELAEYLLAKCPHDSRVWINGWGSDEGSDKEVSGAGMLGVDIFLGYDSPDGAWVSEDEKL